MWAENSTTHTSGVNVSARVIHKDINTYFPISKPVKERYKKLVINELAKQNGEYTATERDHDALVKKAFPRTHKKVALAFKIRNLLFITEWILFRVTGM